MKKTILKAFALIVTMALFIGGLEPLGNDGSWLKKLAFKPEKAEAATSAYSFMYNGTTSCIQEHPLQDHRRAELLPAQGNKGHPGLSAHDGGRLGFRRRKKDHQCSEARYRHGYY